MNVRGQIQEIFQDMQEWLKFWNKLQQTKEKYTLQELNEIYYQYGKGYLGYRTEIRQIILQDKALYKATFELVKQSFLFWILLEGISYDINRQGDHEDSILPILPFPEQLKLVHLLQYGKKHLHIQKSRRQGASVFTSLYKAWLLLTKQNMIMFATHKDLISLDGGLTDIARNSTFGKVRSHLTNSMFMPDDWTDRKKYWNKGVNLYHTTEKQIVIGSNKLNGEVLGKVTSVGFGGNIIFVDELDVVCDMYPNQAKSIFGSFATAVNRMILFSTYRGIDYPFYEIYERYDTSEWDFITLDWHDNPVCNSAWYHAQCSKMNYDEVLIARELDINPAKTREGLIWDTITDENVRILNHKDFDNRKYFKVVGGDFGGGTSATAFIFAYLNKENGKLYLVDLLKTTNMDEYQIQDYFRKIGFLGVSVFGDQSVLSQVGTPQHDWFNVLKKVGIMVIPVYNKDPHLVRATVRRAFANNEIIINKNHRTLVRDLKSANYKNDKLDKNEHSHTADALLYLYRKLYANDSGIKLINY